MNLRILATMVQMGQDEDHKMCNFNVNEINAAFTLGDVK